MHINTGRTNSSGRYGLEVRNASQTHLFVRDDGNIGIGTTSPAARLHVDGNGYALFGPNSTWGASLVVGGNGRVTSNATVTATNGNLHLDARNGSYATFVNWYSQNNTYINGQGGLVGIGSTSPRGKLDVQNGARTGAHASGKALYVTGPYANGASYNGGIEFRHSNASQGIGFGYNTIYATGFNANQPLNLISRGSFPLTLNAYGGVTGNVGIGATSPAAKLEVAGDILTSNALISDDPHGATWAAFSHRNHGTAGGYALLQSSAGQTLLNAASGTHIRFRINNADKMIVNSASKVGIGTTVPAGELDVYSTGTAGPAVLDQSNTSVNASAGGTDQWQSFTAGLSGLLERIDLRVSSPVWPNASSGTIRIYAGQGSGGTLLATQAVTFQPVLNTFQVFNLFSPPTVTAGQQYTIRFSAPTITVGWVYLDTGNPYAGGRASNASGWDYLFKTYVAPVSVPSTTLLVKDGNVGIGTASPDAKFHVAGGSDCGLATNTGYIVTDNGSSKSVCIDDNEILARNNGAKSNLHFPG